MSLTFWIEPRYKEASCKDLSSGHLYPNLMFPDTCLTSIIDYMPVSCRLNSAAQPTNNYWQMPLKKQCCYLTTKPTVAPVSCCSTRWDIHHRVSTHCDIHLCVKMQGNALHATLTAAPSLVLRGFHSYIASCNLAFPVSVKVLSTSTVTAMIFMVAHTLYCKISAQHKRGMTDAWAKHLLHLNSIH